MASNACQLVGISPCARCLSSQNESCASTQKRCFTTVALPRTTMVVLRWAYLLCRKSLFTVFVVTVETAECDRSSFVLVASAPRCSRVLPRENDVCPERHSFESIVSSLLEQGMVGPLASPESCDPGKATNMFMAECTIMLWGKGVPALA